MFDKTFFFMFFFTKPFFVDAFDKTCFPLFDKTFFFPFLTKLFFYVFAGTPFFTFLINFFLFTFLTKLWFVWQFFFFFFLLEKKIFDETWFGKLHSEKLHLAKRTNKRGEILYRLKQSQCNFIELFSRICSHLKLFWSTCHGRAFGLRFFKINFNE